MSLGRKVKTALDETRLLILGAQVLFGFQLQSGFQDAFADLPSAIRVAASAGAALMALSIGLLITPSMVHRISERGEDTERIRDITTLFAELALVPFQISLGLSAFVVLSHVFDATTGVIVGIAFVLLAGLFWFGLEFWIKRVKGVPKMRYEREGAPLSTRIDQMLTEARVLLPGVQALLGFQLTVTLSRAFEELPALSRNLHVFAVGCVAIAMILLMTPAALHRISFSGEDSSDFLKIASWFVVIAPIPLALGLTADLYVVTVKASESPPVAAVLAAVVFVALATLWYVLPLRLRASISAPLRD